MDIIFNVGEIVRRNNTDLSPNQECLLFCGILNINGFHFVFFNIARNKMEILDPEELNAQNFSSVDDAELWVL